MKKVLICIIVCSMLLFTGCNESSENSSTADSNKSTEVSVSENTNGSNSKNDENKKVNKSCNDSSSNTDSSSKKTTPAKKASGTEPKKSNDTGKSTSSKDSSKTADISTKVKNYILNGQGEKPEAGKIKWSSTFLAKVDTTSLYKQYIADGGDKNSVEKFALYITKNAPVQSNWQKLFEADLKAQYGVKVTKLEPLGDGMYQAYIMNEGKEVPYVAVNSRTGYYHG